MFDDNGSAVVTVGAVVLGVLVFLERGQGPMLGGVRRLVQCRVLARRIGGQEKKVYLKFYKITLVLQHLLPNIVYYKNKKEKEKKVL